MKIVFICGGFKEGYDGVGDYTRCLANQLVLSGNKVGVVAINDLFVEKEFNEMQAGETGHLSVLRLPSAWKEEKRRKYAQKWIDEFDPDWLSLQYVIFSFHRKGLPISFHKQLEILGRNRRWHIMFHEVSVGLHVEASFKKKCWGYIQRALIGSFLKKLNPKVIHTHSRLYQAYLEKYKPEIHYLPLFSNIAVNKHHDSIQIKKSASEPHRMYVVIFGAIYLGGAVGQLAKEIVMYEKTSLRKVELQLLGRCGKHAELWTSIFTSEGLNVTNFGEQPAERVSEILSNASIGISTTPIELVEKSSAAAAMRAHNLPILCVSEIWTPRKTKELIFLDGVMEYSPGVFENFMLTSKCDSKITRIDHVSKIFTNSLIDSDKN